MKGNLSLIWIIFLVITLTSDHPLSAHNYMILHSHLGALLVVYGSVGKTARMSIVETGLLEVLQDYREPHGYNWHCQWSDHTACSSSRGLKTPRWKHLQPQRWRFAGHQYHGCNFHLDSGSWVSLASCAEIQLLSGCWWDWEALLHNKRLIGKYAMNLTFFPSRKELVCLEDL